MRKKLLNMLPAVLLLALAGCNGDAGGDRFGECTTAERNAAVYAIMTDWYYWYDQIPDVDPADYESPEALLAAIRYTTLDQAFTFLTTVSEEEAFLSNAAFIGFGISLLIDGDRLFLREAFTGSPAHDAGMRRGDEILAVNGVSAATLIANDQLDAAFGPAEVGHEVIFEIRHAGAADSVSITVAKDEVTIPVVDAVTTDLGAAGDTTYIFFRSFVDPAFNALDAAFAEMASRGDTKLVLDLRYNGGGLLSVARHLGGLIAGTTDNGKVLAVAQFNDKHQEQNTTYLIESLANSTTVTDLVVITTDSTASASELILNGLEPHMNVASVGATTFGKPVGQSAFEFCEEDILRAVTFATVNANGDGEYFDGIPPTCPAVDDIASPLGDADEASLAEALHYLDNGACDPTASVKAARELAKRDARSPADDPLVRDGWDILTGRAR